MPEGRVTFSAKVTKTLRWNLFAVWLFLPAVAKSSKADFYGGVRLVMSFLDFGYMMIFVVVKNF